MTIKKIIVAEVGLNHNNPLSNAIKLIVKALRCWLDIVKFQHANPNLISLNRKKGQYQT